MAVRRIYVEKKQEYAGAAKELAHEFRHYLSIGGVKGVRMLARYDMEGVSDQVYEAAKNTVFAEPPVDNLYEGVQDASELLKADSGSGDTGDVSQAGRVFTVAYLPGQYDQRADSAEQCLKLLKEDEEPVIRTATTYIVEGDISDEEFATIREYCINPVDSAEVGETLPDTLTEDYPEPEDVEILDGFMTMEQKPLQDLYDSLSLAMTFADFCHIQNYFRNEEHRDPTITEIRVLDTYWSDHCRHTTFSTELKHVTFEDGYYRKPIEDTFAQYRKDFAKMYGDREDKFVCLMDLAVLAAKKLKAEGKLDDQEESDEINACSIVVPVEVDGQTEEWLLNFKNETHNHPTEIEPFGGAATCLGGAIRDPLSGRTYVYQAMRVTGAADPTKFATKKPMEGKLPQMKIVREAAHGYSSYGNQIGLSTGYVKEIYHPDYVAKRMEIGAVMAAAPRRAVKRLTSDPGDIIILLGGRTGRDGIGGATGSSKAHDTKSTVECGAEVQKGNPPTERKLQRLFRREEVSLLIKKCNDFGAGGVSVAIGELADGLTVDLDAVPKKYFGLDGTELAISESQERMAVVVAPEDVDAFLGYAAEENLEATKVAVVTEEPRLVLNWRGKAIVDLSRAFLDTNGAHQETDVAVEMPSEADNYFKSCASDEVQKAVADGDIEAAFTKVLQDLNVASQKGLVEMFDSSIGAASVLMPHGGQRQLTPAQSPVTDGKCDAVSMMAYGFDPYLSSWSPYHGAVYAVTESVARIVASGGDYSKIRFSFQEYFRRMTDDPHRWSQPFAALLGAYAAQIGFGLPSIGGKDSMSGTFNEIDVPPTLVSFAVDTAREAEIVTPELKEEGDRLVLAKLARDDYDLVDYEQAMRLFDFVHGQMKKGRIAAAYVVDGYGVFAAVARMAFGNGLGVILDDQALSVTELFAPETGSFVLEVQDGAAVLKEAEKCGLSGAVKLIGQVGEEKSLSYGKLEYPLDEAIKKWQEPLESVFHTKTGASAQLHPAKDDATEDMDWKHYQYEEKQIYICKHPMAKPRVFIPVFPGTNCEYDSAKVFKLAGAETETIVFRNQNETDIRESVDAFVRAIGNAQIVMFPGGFSAGDEPEGSAKFFATAFRNERVKEAFSKLLNGRDGLALGICNGFQALIKLGLVPDGRIRPQDETSPTLTYNTIGRHVSKVAYTKVVSSKSPWLANAGLGQVYAIPASHGEGRFVADREVIRTLFANGQVATQYVDASGEPTMDDEWNINGSDYAIEGITSPDGRVYGKMCHSERLGKGVMKNIYGNKDMKLFESGVKYFQ